MSDLFFLGLVVGMVLGPVLLVLLLLAFAVWMSWENRRTRKDSCDDHDKPEIVPGGTP